MRNRALTITFSSCFRARPTEAEIYVYPDSCNDIKDRTKRSACKQRSTDLQIALANRIYANKIGTGDISSGDGWRYRGCGLKQLTGRGNYQAFADDHKIFWGEAIDFVANPELLNNPIYAVRSGVYFWISKALFSIADAGDQFNNVDKITAVKNLGIDSYGARRRHFSRIYSDEKIFEDI